MLQCLPDSYIYEDRVIAYVDILGWKAACSETKSPGLIQAVQIIDRDASSFTRFIKGAIKDSLDLIPMPLYESVQFAAFSDNFAISMPQRSVCRVISSAAEICRNLLRIGFLTRGAITIGRLHHVDNIIFGPALVEAVKLEKEAVYPRLVCSPELIDIMEATNLEKTGRKECQHIIVDHLGRKIANLFYVLAITNTGQYVYDFEISEIEKIIDDKIQLYSLKRLDKETEKWRYIRDILPLMLNGQKMVCL
jgi:hypothetical protein